MLMIFVLFTLYIFDLESQFQFNIYEMAQDTGEFSDFKVKGGFLLHVPQQVSRIIDLL